MTSEIDNFSVTRPDNGFLRQWFAKGHTMSGTIVGFIHTLIEWAALLIELLAVGVIVGGVLKVAVKRGTVRYLSQLNKPGAYENYKHQFGKPLLLGLDLLVAGDVVRTVALEPMLSNVAALGLLVLIRTFLSWALTIEIEERWPWQAKTTPVHHEEKRC